jgi:hypothetical protein
VSAKREVKEGDDFDDEMFFQQIENEGAGQEAQEGQAEAEGAEEAGSEDSLKTTVQEREERRRLEEFQERLEMRVSISFKSIKRCCKSRKIKMDIDCMCIWNRDKELFYNCGILELDNCDSKDLKSL